MKKWRREARKHNLEASKQEGKRVAHRGRANKPKMIETKAPVSQLVWNLIAFADIKFVRSKKEIQYEIDKANEEAKKAEDEIMIDNIITMENNKLVQESTQFGEQQ